MLDALCFGLFGKPFRKITLAKLINSINEKGLEVEVYFTIGKRKYKIIRGMKPTKLEIYINDKLQEQDAKKGDQQKFLEKSILKLSYNSFIQIVILGSNFKPFMKLTARERREIIEDLLDISIFSAMNSLLKERMKENLAFITELEYEIKLCKEKVKVHKQYIIDIKNNNDKRKVEITQSLSDVESTIQTLNNDIADLTVKAKEYSENYIKLNTELIANQTEFKNKLKVFDAAKSEAFKLGKFLTDNAHCPTCEQDIAPDFKKNKIKELKCKHDEAKEDIVILEAEYNYIHEDEKYLREFVTERYDSGEKLAAKKAELTAMQNRYESIKQQLAAVKQTGNLEKEKSELIAIANEGKKQETKRKSHVEEAALLAVAQEMLKDDGVKTTIIKQYIPVMNKLINKYLASMDFFINFELDENFNEVIKSRHRDDFTYDSFSEGEKSRLDLSLLFAWRSVAKLKNSVNTNLLILDEVFDSSLDVAGMDYLLNIFAEANKDGTNIFVISHRGDVLQDKFDRTIKFEKVKSFSQIEE
jgi:DNA repair exonuclease SbcCD ATPase subunit